MESAESTDKVKKGGRIYIPKGPELTKELLLELSLEDFSIILLGDRTERMGLVAGKSILRGFLFDKLVASLKKCGRLSADERKKKTEEIVKLMFDDIRNDPSFFAGFNLKTGKNEAKLIRDKEASARNREKIKKITPLHPNHKFSLKKMIALSMISADISRLGISASKMVALHVFRDNLPGGKAIHSEDLKRSGPSIYSGLVDIVLRREITDLQLSDEQKSALSSLLKKDGKVEMNAGLESMFSRELSKVLVPKTLEKIELSDEALSALIGIPVEQLNKCRSLLQEDAIVIKLARNKSRMDEKVFSSCPFMVRCLRVAKYLSEGKACRLSCEDCQLYQKHRHEKGRCELPSFGIGSQGNISVF